MRSSRNSEMVEDKEEESESPHCTKKRTAINHNTSKSLAITTTTKMQHSCYNKNNNNYHETRTRWRKRKRKNSKMMKEEEEEEPESPLLYHNKLVVELWSHLQEQLKSIYKEKHVWIRVQVLPLF